MKKYTTKISILAIAVATMSAGALICTKSNQPTDKARPNFPRPGYMAMPLAPDKADKLVILKQNSSVADLTAIFVTNETGSQVSKLVVNEAPAATDLEKAAVASLIQKMQAMQKDEQQHRHNKPRGERPNDILPGKKDPIMHAYDDSDGN